MLTIYLLSFDPDINVRMYADDTVVFTSAKTVDGLILSTAMSKIYRCANHICLNLSKSVSMVISIQSRGRTLPFLLVSVKVHVWLVLTIISIWEQVSDMVTSCGKDDV